MKKLFSMLILLTVVLTLSAQEQKREVVIKKEGMMKANPAALAPTLTPEQQKQMAEFKLNLQKEMLQIDNQLNEKRAQLKTLEQAEKTNMKSVNAKIDEITTLQNQKMKVMAAHKNNVRSILTEEQRVKFDMMNQGMAGMQGKCSQMERGKKVMMKKEGRAMMHKDGKMMMQKEGKMMNEKEGKMMMEKKVVKN